jgi:murein endopeptidase
MRKRPQKTTTTITTTTNKQAIIKDRFSHCNHYRAVKIFRVKNVERVLVYPGGDKKLCRFALIE